MNGAEDLYSVDNIDERPEECFQNWSSGTKKLNFKPRPRKMPTSIKRFKMAKQSLALHP